MVVIRLYRHGIGVHVIRRKLCNGNVIILGVCVKMSAIYMDVEGVVALATVALATIEARARCEYQSIN